MPLYPVEPTGDGHAVRLSSERLVPIRVGQLDSDLFPPGWEPLYVYDGLAPIFLLEIKHVNGSESTWFLDRNMVRLGWDDPGQLSQDVLTVIRQTATQIFVAMWERLFSSHGSTLDNVTREFFSVNSATRRRIFALCEGDINLTVRTLYLDDYIEHGVPIVIYHRGQYAELNVGVLTTIISTNLLASFHEAINSGKLILPSPLSGDWLSSDIGILVTDYVCAYRFFEPSHDLVFYHFTWGNPPQFLFLYIPSINIVVLPRRENPGAYSNLDIINRMYGRSLEKLLLEHLCDYGVEIDQYLCASKRKIAVLLREDLLGCHIWHDLTGLDAIVRKCAPEAITSIIHPPSFRHYAPFGALDGLYPEIAGKVNALIPEGSGLAEITRHIYQQLLCVVRPTDYYVSRNLASRILKWSLNRPEISAERDRLGSLTPIDRPIVLLGLRVENRTAVDLTELCIDIVECLLSKVGSAVIVIDGHNSTSEFVTRAVYTSEFEENATEPPIEVERRIVDILFQAFDGRPVTFVNNIGVPMSVSLFWSLYSHFFVTFYGTGLAKYRWICNKPGLVITSEWTLRYQGHLHIYESDHMEDPTPFMFLGEEFVKDDPVAPLLISPPEATGADGLSQTTSRTNFRVERAGLFAALEELLRSHFLGADRAAGSSCEATS